MTRLPLFSAPDGDLQDNGCVICGQPSHSMAIACWGGEVEGIITIVPPNTCGFRVSLFFSVVLGPISNAAHAKEVTHQTLIAGTPLPDLVHPLDRGTVART